MRHLTIIIMSLLILFAFSPDVFASGYCGFESTETGRQLRVVNYIMVASLHCRSQGNDQKYIDFGKQSGKDRQKLQAKGEKEFKEKMKSSSCRSELGNLSPKEAYDKWMSASYNNYSLQATNNRQDFCSQSLGLTDSYLNGSSFKERRAISENMQIRTVEKVEQVNERIQTRPSVSTYSLSSSHYSGSLYSPPLYQALLPDGYSSFANLPFMMLYVPGVGYVPSTQVGPVNGTYNGLVPSAR